MTPHVPKGTLNRFRARTLRPEEILAIARHLESCSECAARAAGDVDSSAATEMWRGALDAAHEDHLRGDALFDYADQRLSPDALDAADAHLANCVSCRDDISDLRALRGRATRRRLQRSALAAAAMVCVVAGVAVAIRRIPVRHPVESAAPAFTSISSASPVAETPPAAWRALVDAAVANGRIAPPAILATLWTPGDVSRGVGKGQPSAVGPDGVMVEDSRPAFRWTGSPGAVYTLSIFAGDLEVARSAPLHDNVWRPQQDLPRGRAYRWQVEARLGAKTWIIPMTPQPAPTFALLDDAAHRDLDAARRRYPGDHLLLGVMAAHYGLQGEAIEELSRYQSSHPDTRSAALLASVRAWTSVEQR